MAPQPSLLLVDPTGSADLEAMMRRCSSGVVVAGTVETALFELGQHAFDVVVAVLPMPGLGAEGLCREVRARGLPLLVMSSTVTNEWLGTLQAGADDHVRLPCDERELRARLRALVRRYRGELSPFRVVNVGRLTVQLGPDAEVAVEPEIALTVVQKTLLAELAARPGVLVALGALADRVRVAHGPLSDRQVDEELHGLAAALALVTERGDVLQRVDGDGWRLLAGEP